LNFNYSFIQAISIVLLQVHYYSEALPTQHGYCAGISCRSATVSEGPAQDPYVAARAGSRSHDPSDERRWLYQCALYFCDIIFKTIWKWFLSFAVAVS